MNSVVNALPNSSIKALHQTKNTFRVIYENHFLLLPDRRTIVGADGSDPKKLIFEDITRGNPKQIGKHTGFIYTILFDSVTQTLLVGDGNGHVKQYQKREKSKFFGLLKDSVSFTLLKDYGKIIKGWVYSSVQVGALAIFGGTNRSIVAIDISNQQLCEGVLRSPFEHTFSFEVCHSDNSNLHLSIGGVNSNYSLGESDYMDITQIVYGQKRDSDHITLETNEMPTFFEIKDESINVLKLKIQELESEIKKERKRNQGKSNQRFASKNRLNSTGKRVTSIRKLKLTNLLLQTRSDFTKRNLLLLKALNQNREIEDRQSIVGSSIDSKKSGAIRTVNVRVRIAELKETIRTQRL